MKSINVKYLLLSNSDSKEQFMSIRTTELFKIITCILPGEKIKLENYDCTVKEIEWDLSEPFERCVNMYLINCIWREKE